MRTWPPSTKGAWYSSDSAQQICSGSHDGTVAASVPPGFSTRKISSRATLVVGDVLEHLGGDDPVEGVVGEGEARARRRWW